MQFRLFAPFAVLGALLPAPTLYFAGIIPTAAQSASSSSASQSSSSGQMYAREKAPSLIDPAGPTISLISAAEPVFDMTAALNACGFDEGLEQSDPIRRHIRDEMNQAFAQSEEARAKRDAVCLYIAQHRMTGSERDIAQYISLALYLTPPPELEITADQTEMPPDATQVAEIVPLLRAFAAATDLHGIWLAAHRAYDGAADKLHDPLSQMIVATNIYLKMPAATYSGSRFIVVIEPQLSPNLVNARIYGTDYIVVVSPVNGALRLNDVRHTYLHYIIDPLLYARSNAIDREQPILKQIRDAPLEFRLRSDTVALTVECLIKAIEARTMDTGIPEYKIPAGVDRSQLPIYEHQRQQWVQKVDAAKWAQVQHDQRQGYVLTQYFYQQMIQFEKDPASLKDTIGEMVYSMDVAQQASLAKQIEFDKQADEDVLQQSKPRQLAGLDLAEAKLAAGDTETARAMAQKALAAQTDTIASTADAARAHFILARVDLMSVHPNQTEDEVEKTMDDAVSQFQTTIAATKDQRLVSWSHIYLGRMLDLQCKRDQALAEYKEALATRDGQLDTRLAAERGVKAAYVQRGHEKDCEDDDADVNPAGTGASQPAAQKPEGKPSPK